MPKFIAKRVLLALPVLILSVTIVFFLMRILPGNPAAMILGKDAHPEDMAKLEESMGLNDPIPVQYVRYIKDIATGNWGNSLCNQRPVFENIAARFEPTLLIMIYSILISVIIGVPLGIISAVHRSSPLDYTLMGVSVIGLSVPVFWTSIMLSYFIGAVMGWFPSMNYQPIAQGGLLNSLRYVTLPSVALGIQSVASNARYTRSTMLDVLGEDYVRTARAKGLPEKIVLYKHALKNALSPVVTHVGINMASLLGGATVCETVFNINGMGKLAYDSLLRRDYVQVQAIILVVAIIYIVINIALDIIYKILDPRVELN